MELVSITDHAYKRASQRLGWAPNTLDRLIRIVLHWGAREHDTVGELRSFVYRRRKGRGRVKILVFCGQLFVFKAASPTSSHQVLVTIYGVPPQMAGEAKMAEETRAKRIELSEVHTNNTGVTE